MRFPLVIVGVVLTAGCSERIPVPMAPGAPARFSIADGANDGNPHFFFLPPLVPAPATGGVFDATLEPRVEICEWSGNCRVPVVAVFTASGSGSETVRVDSAAEHYVVNWHTKEFVLDVNQTYRIRVEVAGVELGHADIDLVSNRAEARTASGGDLVPLVNGRTLPIKFRIEEGALARCVAAPQGLIAWWPGDGSASDLVGNNHGTLRNGATFAPGLVGPAFRFDGIDDFVVVPEAPNLTPPNVTVEFWFRPASTLTAGSGFVPLLYKLGEDDNSGGIARGFDFYFDAFVPFTPGFGSLVFRIPRETGAGIPVAVSADIDADTWHHVAGSYDQSELRLYFEGQLVDALPASSPIAYTPAPIVLGRVKNLAHSGNPFYLNGLIDEVSLYGRALAPSEIAGIVAAGREGKCKP